MDWRRELCAAQRHEVGKRSLALRIVTSTRPQRVRGQQRQSDPNRLHAQHKPMAQLAGHSSHLPWQQHYSPEDRIANGHQQG